MKHLRVLGLLPIPLVQKLKKKSVRAFQLRYRSDLAARQDRCFAARVVTWFESSRWSSRNGIS